MRKDITELSDAVETTLSTLCLAKHSVGVRKEAQTTVVGPGDMEGHLGKDGRYYLVDLARLMPPEAPLTYAYHLFFRIVS